MDNVPEGIEEAQPCIPPPKPNGTRWLFVLLLLPLVAAYFLLLFLRNYEFVRAYFWIILWRAVVVFSGLIIGSKIIDTAITEFPEKIEGLNLWGALMKAYSEMILKARELWTGLRKKSRLVILSLIFIGCFVGSYYSYQPYRIPQSCRNSMSHRLSGITSINVTVSSYSGDNSALQLGKDLMQMAQDAGWGVSPNDMNVPLSFMLGRGELFYGVEIKLYGVEDPAAPEGMITYDIRQAAAAEALSRELKKLRIPAKIVGPLKGDAESAKDIHLEVGPKP